MLITLIRTVILYVSVVACIRIMGKRQIGDMQPNELVVTILLSEIASLPIQDINQPVLIGVVSMFSLVVLELLLSMLSLKWGRARTLLNGRPTIIINDGKLDQQAMKRVRVSVDDLLSCLRQQGAFSIDEVRYAIIETNGQLSVMLREQYQPVTVQQAGVQPGGGGLAVPVVCDGRRQSEFMSVTGISEGELSRQLKAEGVEISEVFLMTIDAQGKVVVIRRGESV